MLQEIAHIPSLRSLVFPLSLALLAGIILSGCTGADAARSLLPGSALAEGSAAESCPLTEPQWVKPPEDAAVDGSPGYGHYFVNEDESIWAAAWWTGQEDFPLRASDGGTKTGWFRPAGAELEISGRRLDGPSSASKASVPCCYPTRFQATGLTFPTEGCWEVTAKAAAGVLSFVVWVEP